MKTNDLRLKYILANWKMNLRISEVLELTRAVLSSSGRTNPLIRIGLTPSFSALSEVHKLISGSNIMLGMQNCASQRTGSFTGEESINLLSELGINYVLVGHSERRHLFKESNQQIAKKVSLVIQENKLAVLCVGETAKVRRQNKQKQYVGRQIQSALTQFLEPAKLIIAYEPVWAISSQKSHYQTQLSEIIKMHYFIRKLLEARFGDVSAKIPILYGGSVTVNNFVEYWQSPGIDGVLIGQASTTTPSFLSILKQAF